MRVAEYAAVGSALAWDRPAVVSPDEPMRIMLRVIFADRSCDRAGIADLLAAR